MGRGVVLEGAGGAAGSARVSQAKAALMCAAQWLALGACAGTTPSWEYSDPFPLSAQPIPCGQPPPADCQYRRLHFAELPTNSPRAEGHDEPLTDANSHAPSLQARMALGNRTIAESTFGLERVARGFFGDSVAVRKSAEQRLAMLLKAYGDDGGAVDLTYLGLREVAEERLTPPFNQEWLVALSQRCRSAKMLHTLTLVPESELVPWFDAGKDFRVALGLLNLLRARGLVELGEYDEARALFRKYGSMIPYEPDFVPQCIKWLDGRVEEATPLPVGRPCNCDIEPPKWRAGCGCRDVGPAGAGEPTAPGAQAP